MSTTVPGIYLDMPAETYHTLPGYLGHTQAIQIAQEGGPAKHKYALRESNQDTTAFRFGRACHKHILERKPLNILPYDSVRTKEAKTWVAENPDYVTEREANQITAMGETLDSYLYSSHQHDMNLLAEGVAETTLLYKDPETGGGLKARPDWLPTNRIDGAPVIVDYKTCQDASPRGFAKNVAKFGYHQQAAWYIDAYQATHPGEPEPVFLFIAQEKTAPYLPAVYRLDPADIQAGREHNREAIRVWNNCRIHKTWPGYTPQIITLRLPDWARQQ